MDEKKIFRDLSARGPNEEEVELKKLAHNLCSPEDDGTTEKKMKRLTLEPNQQISEASPTPYLRLI
jgi:hypothetical protein